MTDSIDLDDIDVQDEEGETGPNRGDWLWGADGEPDGEPDDAEDGLTGDDIGNKTPRVPSETDGKPVGIPTDSGGAGSGVSTPEDSRESTDKTPEAANAGDDATETDPETEVWDVDEDAAVTTDDSTPTSGAASPAGVPTSDGTASEPTQSGGVSGPVGSGASAGGPHGGDADEMTLAFTYRAARALDDPSIAYGDAKQWTDWLGIVGDVPSHALNKFQRRHTIDLDFFNGAATRPSERLAEIDPSSMFYAERLVLVGLPDEAGMEPEGWEFRPLPEAAEKADWGYTLPENGAD